MRPLTSSLSLRSVLSTNENNEPLLVVSRGSTRSEKTQIADLPSGTMRRISRARSLVSGVELWHPAKTTTRKSRCFCALHHHDRMLMSSCHIAFEHRHHLAFCLHKTICRKTYFCFLKRSVFIQTPKPGIRIILFCLLSVCRGFV